MVKGLPGKKKDLRRFLMNPIELKSPLAQKMVLAI